jgi:rhodanese-related sulfurtransferase
VQETLEISARELSDRLSGGERIVILDVREPEEFAIARIPGSVSIPMGNVATELQNIEALGDQGDLAVLCHHGVRSLNVTAWLRQQGVENCFSVAGGIDGWSIEIDPSVPRY